MRIEEHRPIVARIAFALSLLLAACDAGADAPLADGGVLEPDAATPAPDAGQQSLDAGVPDSGFVPPPCTVTAPTACPNPAPTYTAEIVPIIQARCISCHSGVAGGPWPLTDYAHIADWSTEVRGMILECSMPPPEAQIPMPVEERVTILTWILCGLPR